MSATSGTSPTAAGSVVNSTPWIVSFVVMWVYAAPGASVSARSASVGTRRNPSASPVQAMRMAPVVAASFAAFVPHDPVITRSAARSSPWGRLRATIENCCVAPPWQNRTWWDAGIASNVRRFASASAITPSNHGPRCETSSAEAPTPGSESRSRRTSSSTGCGRMAGPAAKLTTRSLMTEPGYRRGR